jgi:hypothetical protein
LWLLEIVTSTEDASLIVLSSLIIIIDVDKKIIALKAPRQCPLVLPVNVRW